MDDDGDRLVDLNDPGCQSSPDDDEANVAPPPSGGFPDASNTGVPAGTNLTPSGGMTISTAGTVIDARDISGCVVVNAPKVRIERSGIRANCFWVIDNNSTGLLLEDVEIDGLNGYGTCIDSSNLTVRRADIHGCENGFNVSIGNLSIDDSYVHGLTTGGTAHTDGAQFGQRALDIVFRHNTIVAGVGGGSTSCIIMWDADGPQNQRVWIENNRLLCSGAG